MDIDQHGHWIILIAFLGTMAVLAVLNYFFL